MHSTLIRINVKSAAKAEKIVDALIPESEATQKFRSQLSIKKHGSEISLIFKAPDISSLRASVNSFTRWVWLLNKTLETLDSMEK